MKVGMRKSATAARTLAASAVLIVTPVLGVNVALRRNRADFGEAARPALAIRMFRPDQATRLPRTWS
jgi:hypothetical protein